MPAIEEEYTWTEELHRLIRAILEHLEVSYTPRHLRGVVAVEEAHWFRSRDRTPRRTPYPYRRRPEDPRNQIGAVERVLAEFGVHLQIFTAPLDDLRLSDVPFLFLLRGQRKTDNPSLVLALDVDDGTVTTLSPDGTRRREQLESLESRWAGLIAVASADEESGEEDLELHRRAGLLSSAAGTVGVGLMAASLGYGVWMLGRQHPLVGGLALASLALKALGLMVSLRLKRLEATRWYGNSLVERFCKLGEAFDCQRLLALPGAKLLGLVSWSDVGAGYFLFSGSLVALAGLWSPPASEFLAVAAVLALVALPYTLYSIYYQGLVARVWCMLCLSVQMVLWVDAAALTWLHFTGLLDLPSPPVLATASGLLVLSVGLTALHHSYVKGAVDKSIWRLRALALQRDPGAVLGMLEHGFHTELSPLPGDLFLGTGSETVCLTAVLDPECPFCAAAYHELRSLRRRTSGRFSLRVRVMREATPLETMRDLLAFTVNGRDGEAVDFLDNWYDRVLELRALGRTNHLGRIEARSYQEWRNSLDVHIPNEDERVRQAVDAHGDWQRTVFFEKWPVLFVNGHYWPAAVPFEKYLDFHLDDIEEWVRNGGGEDE